MNDKRLLAIQAMRKQKIVFLDEVMSLEELMNNVVRMRYASNRITEAVLMELRTFDDIFPVIQALRERKIVFLDLAFVNFDLAQQVFDFIAGSAHATDGNQGKIGQGIFLFISSYGSPR
ncbi:MAG TPA: cell division protein SepF [Coleofasciculaceae cyanobacterium]